MDTPEESSAVTVTAERGQGVDMTEASRSLMACQIFVMSGLEQIGEGKTACVINDFHSRRPDGASLPTVLPLYAEAAAEYGLYALEVTMDVHKGAASHKHHYIILTTERELSTDEIRKLIPHPHLGKPEPATSRVLQEEKACPKLPLRP
jgi:hypothetical protein